MKYFPTHRQGSVATGVQLSAASAEQLQNTNTAAASSSAPFIVLWIYSKARKLVFGQSAAAV